MDLLHGFMAFYHNLWPLRRKAMRSFYIRSLALNIKERQILCKPSEGEPREGGVK